MIDERSISAFRRLLYLVYFLEVGLLLALIPWSPYWERNFFAERLPLVAVLVTNNFFRGAVSGLGLVNLFAGFAELATLVGANPPAPVRAGGGHPDSAVPVFARGRTSQE